MRSWYALAWWSIRGLCQISCIVMQYQALKALIPLLSEEEASVVRRGKNASKATVAKHATAQEYRASTALEALFGWLYLRGEEERIYQLFDVAWNAIEAAEQPE